MNCIVLNGIAAGGRPDLEAQVGTLVHAMESRGHRVRSFTLRQEKLHGCVGCFSCWVKTPGTCIFKDGMEDILAAELDCDRLIYVSDFHLHFLSPLLKTVLDRSQPLYRGYMRVHANGRLAHYPRYDLRYRTMLLMENHPFLEEDDLAALNASCGSHKGLSLGAMRLDTACQEVCHALFDC